MENDHVAPLTGRARLATFTKYEDPGHGWLRVPLTLLDTLGIRDKITHYSYQHGHYAYLEEDCDCATFDAAMQVAGRAFTVTHSHTNRDSHIRSYARFPHHELALS